jgi:membrane protein YdbS with pleckstrin-like domain
MTNRRVEDPAQADRAWAGYHPRAALPTVTGAAVASLLVWTGRWFLDDLSELADRVGALAVFALAWCVWPGIVALYLYRTLTYTYRLTDRAVLVDFGFRHEPVPPVWLADVAQVRTGAGWLGRILGVGWVEVRTAARTVRLVGVRRPEEFADRIRTAQKTATDGGPQPPVTV